ncbi:DUF4260 domain-containing protein [Mesorhizobium sp. CGMCC 1.15528]|uniref:DUF4260 domain-containing protein n=1 Tax=Mesorhizobium zhangyense TaxID=1776730 RepID=A0A7C9R8M3_9HYPH|nr:DUF4260 domain-containing protein [Mesorhizobium zhangyense]NGN42519.1 DUF4260 domain-containing protein [Mesorhizobium zhangyense]
MRPVDLIVRLEWIVVAVGAIAAYAFAGGSWPLFVLLILAPDLAMLGYLAGPRVGAFAYNMLHVLIWPLVMLAVGLYIIGDALVVQIAFIWIAHIAIDRALGYGLKLATGFQDTHLGRIGRDKT